MMHEFAKLFDGTRWLMEPKAFRAMITRAASATPETMAARTSLASTLGTSGWPLGSGWPSVTRRGAPWIWPAGSRSSPYVPGGSDVNRGPRPRPKGNPPGPTCWASSA